ncbi:MAG TPA: sugar phosphate nucleotidyltransferase, partial [bacterium]|nr:sugar phosphate nucleotidyltransferase [bacterium]
NRPWHTEQTVEALKKNELASESDLFIFSDGPKVENDENVKKVREYIRSVRGFKSITIFEKDKNQGLANSIISGVTEIINKYGKVIVLEDDIVTSTRFLQFMNEALDKYEGDKKIFSVSGYNVPMKCPAEYDKDVFLSYRYSSWGWATWIDRWEEADWSVQGWEEVFLDKGVNKKFQRGGEDLHYIFKAQMNGTLNSWAIRWYYSHFRKERFTVFPVKSLVENIGFDGSGVHCGNAKNAPNKPVMSEDVKLKLPEKIEFDKKMNELFATHFRYGLKDKIRRFLKELIGYKIRKQ